MTNEAKPANAATNKNEGGASSDLGGDKPAEPIESTLNAPHKIGRTAEAIQRIKKYEGVLIVIAAGMVLLGFIVRDNKLEEAKKAEQESGIRT